MSLIKHNGGFIPRDRDWQPDALTPPYKTSVKRSPQAALPMRAGAIVIRRKATSQHLIRILADVDVQSLDRMAHMSCVRFNRGHTLGLMA